MIKTCANALVGGLTERGLLKNSRIKCPRFSFQPVFQCAAFRNQQVMFHTFATDI